MSYDQLISQSHLRWNLIGTLVLKFSSLAISVLILPSYLRYFENKEVLGIWFVVLSLVSWVLFFDFGLGNGLKNRLIGDFAGKRFRDAVSSITTTYAGMLGGGLVIAAAVALTIPMAGGLRPAVAIVVKSQDPDVIAGLIVIAVALFFQFQLRLVSAILLAQQKSALNALLPFTTQVIVWLFLILASGEGHTGSFLSLAYAYSAAMLAPLLLATLAVYRDVRKWEVPLGGTVDAHKFVSLAGSGGKFFWIQLCLLGINGSNELFILHLARPEEVVTYQAYSRLFSIIVFGIATLTVPVWGAMGQARALGDGRRIVRLAQFLGAALLLAVLTSLALALTADAVIVLWLGEAAVELSDTARWLFAIYAAVMALILCAGCIANAFESLTAQLWSLTLALVLKLILLFAVFSVESWIDVMMATTLCLLPAAVWLGIGSGKLVVGAVGRMGEHAAPNS
ncbi:MAG: hypothetical protein AAFX56_10070 [Pseudomonadota bacterium]